MNLARPANPRTERMLAAPIAPALARLSAPGMLLVVFQSLVSVGDTYFVGRLGTGPLAGLALVFPLIMLLQMTSAGAMGGGVSSAVARALGSGDAAAARRLVVHALVIAAAMGATVGDRLGKPSIPCSAAAASSSTRCATRVSCSPARSRSGSRTRYPACFGAAATC
jgi:hypothetical protein